MNSNKLTANLDYEVFTYWHAFFLVGAIVTYVVDMTLDVVVSATYFYEGYYWYGAINLGLVLIPAVIVQIFSVRWYQMDSMMKRSYWYIHAMLMGVVQRYLLVLKTGFEAMKTGDAVTYQQFYQLQSDVCMLRLFDSFSESAPQLVFHLYVMILKSHWPIEQAAWTGTSAIVSLISLGWGIAAYSSAQRMIREDKNKMTWTGMILQTFWRAGMISARLTALIMLALAIHHWIFIVMFVHWLLMTGWIVWQNTDFCATQWEERFYNAVVGIIYCFCFFNLKEGRSRNRATIFYSVIIVENFSFVAVFFFVNGQQQDLEFSYWISVAAFLLVSIGTLIGLCGMLLYYRFFHPAGPIKPFVGESVDFSLDPDCKLSPDFVIHDASGASNETAKSSSSARRRQTLPRHSRSFKMSCPPPRRRPRQDSFATSDVGPSLNASQNSRTGCPTMTSERIDSTYGTDSNRTVSPQDAKSEPAHNVSNTSSLSIAFNNDTYASVDVNNATHHSVADKKGNDKSINDVSYASVNPRTPKTPKSRRTSINETYMSVQVEQQQQPEVLLKRSPVVRDVTTAHIASTQRLSSSDASSKPLPTLHSEVNQKESTKSGYKMLSSIPGAGKKLSQENKSTSTSSIDAKSGYKLLSSIPGAGKNVMKQNKSTSCDATSILINNRTSTGKTSADKMTAPLTIIIPNISRAFARPSRSKSGEDTPDLSDKTISMEILNPKSTLDHSSNFSTHDYENLALININRSSLAKGLAHWRTYSDMADNKHDDSVACDQRHNKDYSNYASLHYFDIYPLSKEIKEQLYRSLTPASTAATIATSDDCGFTNSNESDTYEPIEAFQDFFGPPKAIGGHKTSEEHHDESKKQDSLNDTYGDLKVPVPVTLIHHDGKRLTTRQIVSMESLREVIRKHEKVPMDDPQDRGDLYLLAPMRLLLSPIAEEPEMNEAQPSHVTEVPGNDFNKSLMTVISELLSTTYSTKSFLHSTAVPNQPLSNLQQFNPDGHYQDSVDSASSLVSIIDEIRNNSLCNLLYMTNSSADIRTKCDKETTPLPPSPIKLSDQPPNPGKGKPCANENSPQAVNATMVVHNRDGSVRSVRSNIVTSSPIKNNAVVDQPFPGTRKTPPLYSSVASKTGNVNMVSPVKHQNGGGRKTSPLYTSVGSRKNLLELAGSSAESAILNTPKKIEAEKFSVVPMSKPSPQHETRKLGYYQPFPKHQNEIVEPKPVEFVQPSNSSDLQLRHSRIVRPKPVLTYSTPGVEYTSDTRPKPFISTVSHNSSEFETSYRPTALTHFPALSPSAKYNSDNTPTPPLRDNQFVRRVSNNNSNQPRRKFSIIREHFESPELRRRVGGDLYENISNNQLDPVMSSTRDKCQSVPSIFADLELRADQKYDGQFGGNLENRSRSHWSTASFQKVPPTLASRNVPNRRSMSIIADSSSTFQIPPRKPVYFDNKENERPVEKAPAIPPRASTRLASNKSTLSPKSQIFSRLI